MHRKKILIVDDSLIILKAFSMKLRASGYEVVMAQDGSSAVNSAREHKPDLVLLDINFPADVVDGKRVAWDGFLILDWLRRNEEGKNVPVFMITGGDPAKYRERAAAAGVVRFFQKPISPEGLLAAIRETLGDEEGADAKPQAGPGPKG